MYEDMPQRKVWDVFMELLYGDQPAGWNIAGPKKTVKTFKRNDFVAYRNTHYRARNLTSNSGWIQRKRCGQKIESHFSKLERGNKGTKRK